MSEAANSLCLSHQQETIRRSLYVIASISIVALASSFWLEVFTKVEPCKLCQAQRAFYFFTMIFAVVGVFSSSMKRAVSMLILLLSLGNLGTASYQFGIQLGAFPDVCAVVSPATLHDFKSMLFLKQHALDSCSSITWMFGLPVVVWSILFSVACLLAGVWGAMEQKTGLRISCA